MIGLETHVIACLLAIGVSHLGYSFIRRALEPSSLYFVLFCIVMMVRSSLAGDPSHDTAGELSRKAEYLSIVIGLPILAMYFRSLFPEDMWPSAVRFIQLCGAVLSLLTLFTSARIFAGTLPMVLGLVLCFGVYTLLMLAVAMRRKRRGALLLLCGWAIFVGALVHDIAFKAESAGREGWFSAGLLVLIVIQTYMLGYRSAKLVAAAEKQARDLTKRNSALEAKVTESTMDLVVASQELEKANAERERLEQSRRSMLVNISHDLGTPLSIIQGFTEAMMNEKDVSSEQRQQYIRLIHARMAGMHRLIERLGESSYLDEGLGRYQFRKMTVEQIAAQVNGRYEAEVAETNRLYESFITPGASEMSLWEVEVDMYRLDQALTNIVYHAIGRTPEKGTIRISFMLEERELVVRIADGGKEMDSAELPYLFERADKQEDAFSAKDGGTGMTLAISKKIVEQHGGRIWAEGTAVSFTVPLMRGERKFKSDYTEVAF
ncbi:ATP-binding protein [Paenibacillus sp. MBLB4367]|uniref:sensor histidine kinase n=1 Tax=Paenibacillus sp. MBLB4367 TaxID=3384767 RepID=UPI003907EEB3